MQAVHTPYVDSFSLVRTEDESGVSGTGTVAVGARFPGGRCVVSWLTPVTSVTVYDSVSDVVAIHGHGGKTRLKWDDDTVPPKTNSPFHRGQADRCMDGAENAFQHIEKTLDGERPKWGAEWSDVYFSEYLAGYKWQDER